MEELEKQNIYSDKQAEGLSLLEELLKKLPQDRHLEVVKKFNRLGLRQDDEVMVLLYTMLYIKGMYEDVPDAMKASVERVEQALIQLGVKFEDAVDEVFKEAAARAAGVTAANSQEIVQSGDKLLRLAEAIQADMEERRQSLGKEADLVRAKTQKLFVEAMKKELPSVWAQYLGSFYSAKRIARDVAVVAMGFGICQLVLELARRIL